MMETWKAIPYYPEYEISNLGRLRRCLPSIRSSHTYPGKLLKLSPNYNGYLGTYLYSNGKRVYRKIHQLVAETFLGPQPMGTHVHHLNGIKIDNRVDNLNYVHGCQHYRAASIDFWTKYKMGLAKRATKYKKRSKG